jgi:DNA replication protein DnaC
MKELSKEQMTRMRDSWGFSRIHLRYTREDLNLVPDWMWKEVDSYVENFTLNEDKLFERFKQGDPPGLFIYSPIYGNGKTSVIHQIAMELVLSSKPIRKMKYTTGLGLFNELKSTFKGGVLNESELLDDVVECDVLFLDDLDKIGSLSEYEKKRFSFIVDKRYTSLKPVVITGNKSIEQMLGDRHLEDSVYSRFNQMCKEFRLDNEQDFRTKKNKQRKSKLL